jgi:hypothetical protein
MTMTTTPKVLIEAKLAEAGDTVQYTAENCKAAIDKFTATNVTGANATITVHLVPASSGVAVANAFTKTIPPGVTWPFPEIVGHLLELGDSISTNPGAANTFSIRASGREFT